VIYRAFDESIPVISALSRARHNSEPESIETTEVYLHASMAMKEKALAKATPGKTRSDRYQPDDRLLAFLKNL
jgi:hypothetical protein